MTKDEKIYIKNLQDFIVKKVNQVFNDYTKIHKEKTFKRLKNRAVKRDIIDGILNEIETDMNGKKEYTIQYFLKEISKSNEETIKKSLLNFEENAFESDFLLHR